MPEQGATAPASTVTNKMERRRECRIEILLRWNGRELLVVVPGRLALLGLFISNKYIGWILRRNFPFHSNLTFASLMTAPHLSISDLRYAASTAGVEVSTDTP